MRRTELQFDYKKLRGRIIEKCGSIEAFAKAIGMSLNSISLLLNHHQEWRQSSIQKAIIVLDIRPEDIPVYFFTLHVQDD